MDVSDMICAQSDTAADSTLESEIDALSKIITDSKDDAEKLEEVGFKLDSDDVAFTDTLQCDATETNKYDLDLNDILDDTGGIGSSISTSNADNELPEILKESDETDQCDQENWTSSSQLQSGTSKESSAVVENENRTESVQNTESVADLLATESQICSDNILVSTVETVSINRVDNVNLKDISDVIGSTKAVDSDELSLIHADENAALSDNKLVETEEQNKAHFEIDQMELVCTSKAIESSVILQNEENSNVVEKEDLMSEEATESAGEVSTQKVSEDVPIQQTIIVSEDSINENLNNFENDNDKKPKETEEPGCEIENTLSIEYKNKTSNTDSEIEGFKQAEESFELSQEIKKIKTPAVEKMEFDEIKTPAVEKMEFDEVKTPAVEKMEFDEEPAESTKSVQPQKSSEDRYNTTAEADIANIFGNDDVEIENTRSNFDSSENKPSAAIILNADNVNRSELVTTVQDPEEENVEPIKVIEDSQKPEEMDVELSNVKEKDDDAKLQDIESRNDDESESKITLSKTNSEIVENNEIERSEEHVSRNEIKIEIKVDSPIDSSSQETDSSIQNVNMNKHSEFIDSENNKDETSIQDDKIINDDEFKNVIVDCLVEQNNEKKESSPSPLRVETPEDPGSTLELEHHDQLEKTTNSKATEEPKEGTMNVYECEENIRNDEKICKTKELLSEVAKESIAETEVDFDLSLDPEEYSSPVTQSEEPTVSTELASKQVAPILELNELLERPHVHSSEMMEVNKKVDELINSDSSQGSDLQDAASDFWNKIKPTSDSKNVLEIIEDVHVLSNIVNEDAKPLIGKSDDPLYVLENVAAQEKGEMEKEDELTLNYEESSQSSTPIESIDVAMQDVQECNEPEDLEESNLGNNDSSSVSENLHIFSKVADSKSIEQYDPLQGDAQLTDKENEKIMCEQSSEMSELESAVKFLQESEEQTDEAEDVAKDTINTNPEGSRVFVSVDDGECDNASELPVSVPGGSPDPIAISEAEIISEAAKLENERKQKQTLDQQLNVQVEEKSALPNSEDLLTFLEPNEEPHDVLEVLNTDILKAPLMTETKPLPDSSAESSETDETLKGLPKLKFPESSEISSYIPTPDLQEHKKVKQRLESPDRTSSEPRISETPKKESTEKHQQQQLAECENVGSPRIILKIAKSAIADCSEPRSPKSPKIRSAANSPAPEDSPTSQKLGKIKLKLSRGCHPSIIHDTESHEEAGQWHTDSSVSSGVKIKLTKSADISTEGKHEEDEMREKSVHKSEESPIGMKIKLSKTGDVSIIQQDNFIKESSPDVKHKHKDNRESPQEVIKKQDSPSIGMKIKLSKSGDASIIQPHPVEDQRVEEEIQEGIRRTDSPIGMKIKFSKSGDASVISNEALESSEARQKVEDPHRRTDSPIGMKIKLSKTKDGTASIISNENIEEIKDSNITAFEASEETSKIGIGMKIKLSKSGDASVVQTIGEEIEPVKKSSDQHLGMKIKLSKTGDPSIIHSEVSEVEEIAHGVKSKHSKCHSDPHLEMKIKLSKTGHPTIITPSDPQEDPLKLSPTVHTHKLKESLSFKDTTLKSIKKSHCDLTIEPIQNQAADTIGFHGKRKELTIAPVEAKKSKTDVNLKQMLPDITIQPIAKKEQRPQSQLLLDSNSGSISRQQMNVINQEISITQVRSLSSGDILMGEHLKSSLNVQSEASPLNSDCEIIETPQPELIIVNENSNSSQDIMIIDEVTPTQVLPKIPRKRGRPRRNANLPVTPHIAPSFQNLELQQRDPLSLDQPTMHMQQQFMQQVGRAQQVMSHITPGSVEGSERPRRTCRSQKSYAPPKRGRGRGRGKRKNEAVEMPMKKARIDQDLTAIENATTARITIEKLPVDPSSSLEKSSELFRALNQPTLDRIPQQQRGIRVVESGDNECEVVEISPKSQIVHKERLPHGIEMTKVMPRTHDLSSALGAEPEPMQTIADQAVVITKIMPAQKEEIVIKVTDEDAKQHSEMTDTMEGSKEHQNWLAPSIKKVSNCEPSSRNDSILNVMDEETRMSAESGSRSQTPARNMSAPGTSETLVNEESQNSVLSTATTESEKVKVQRSRRMEINFDPDEGPFTVEKLAEYEWPPASELKDRVTGVRSETFMIQEQISHYLGVKSFKRKYPDLKRRMVDMEERNFLREHGLVSESMCDMGLTAVSSSEVLDIMCSDFPEQYEEYRKYIREKAVKEHSKKQKELSAAASAERNRIDLAEMAMQSAISWNSTLNKTRQDARKSSLDLQTFTLHMPRRPFKYDSAKRGSDYPCALITGQFTDYFRQYRPSDLRYYPVNTIVYGSTRQNDRKFDSQSEGSQSDSDSDSSSDDSSSSSSEGTQDTEGSQSTMDEVDMELAIQSDVKCKLCSNNLNKKNRPEVLIQCGTCSGNVHPSCIDLTLDMVPHIRAYAWQCTDCKTCAQCHDPADEDKMLFCDMCDRGYHIYCVGLRRVPQGRWHCQECAVCANCGSKEPGGANSDRNSVAQWQHEFKKGDKNTRVYVSTFCVPCSKLWRKGRYCPHCSRCHNAQRLDLEPNLVHCGACDKYLHLECVETKGVMIDKKNYFCEFCAPNRQQLVKPLISKTFKT